MVPKVSQVNVVEESDELPSLHIGRIIGKDGQMVRDLQARSGCRIAIDQKNEPGQYSTIIYRGKIDDIVFAKRLVSMLCNKEDGAGFRLCNSGTIISIMNHIHCNILCGLSRCIPITKGLSKSKENIRMSILT